MAESQAGTAHYGVRQHTSRGTTGLSVAQARSAVLRYGIALLCVAAAFFPTLILQRFFAYPFLFLFIAAIMTSAWFGGTGAGLFAVLLSTAVAEYFFVPPFYSFEINATDTSYFIAFVICSLVASSVSASKKRNAEALGEARDQLEIRVAERTAELQKSNAELRESEHQLRLLTEVIPQQIWSGTPDGSIDYCNQRLLDYVGCSMDEMKSERFMETIHPADRDLFRESWHTALMTGEPVEGEWRVRRADGEYRTFVTRAVPLRQAEGKPLRWYGTNTDIEDHKKSEQALMRSQTELAHLSRVLTMGELTASIAHEVNQPLAAVVTYGHACLEWLSAKPPNVEEAREAAKSIIRDGTRAGSVIGRIRALFRKESPQKGWFDMNEAIQELAVFIRGEALLHRVSIRTELATDLPKVKADRVQLQQVVLNMIVNGMDAMRNTDVRSRELLIRSQREGSSGIAVQVEDSGEGLPAEFEGKIFNPFFSTKAQGIGMGLSIGRSIIESHGGRLWATPHPSGGAIFQFTIPIGS
jgi:PAS domain S-box-containing protein